MTLRTRMVFAAATLIVVLMVGGLILLRSVHSTQLDAVDRQVSAAVPLARDLAGQSAPTDPDQISELSSVYVALVNSAGARQVLLRPSTVTSSEPTTTPAPVAQGQPLQPMTSPSEQGPWSWRITAVQLDPASTLVVAVPFDPDDFNHASTAVLLDARILLLIAVGISGWWLIRLALRPLAEITRVANAISSGDRTRRVPEGRLGTEATTLARAFNDMLDAQHAAEDRLRRFIADASHELRTPVAAISGFADLYRHQGIDPSQLDDVMRRIGQEASRMRGLVEDLLLLARLDEGRPLSLAPIDLVVLANDAAWDASATHPSRTVTVSGASTAPLTADEAALRQVLANLVTNALSHTTGAVAIEIITDGNRVTLSVADDGPGVDPDTQQQMFDRFWRGAAARAGTGTGLGLPIVAGIVTAHQGTVDIVSAPTSGTRITINLPR